MVKFTLEGGVGAFPLLGELDDFEQAIPMQDTQATATGAVSVSINLRLSIKWWVGFGLDYLQQDFAACLSTHPINLTTDY